MSTKFRSSDPAVLSWWEQAKADRADFNERVDAWVAEHGMGRKPVVLGGWTISVVGLETIPEDRKSQGGPPEGWRRVDGRHASWIQPYRRTKAQKAIHASMPKMPEPRESLAGYEHQIFPGGLPGLFLHDGTVYAESSHPERFDAEVWTEILRSEYLAAQAAHAAEHEAAKATP